MAEIGSINTQAMNTQASFFATNQVASQFAASESKKTEKSSKTRFSDLLKKNSEESLLASEGLPAEIAGMSDAEAIVFLKDAVDIAGDELQKFQSLEAMEKYRKKVQQFMKFVVKNNFVINKEKLSERMRQRISKRTGRPVDPKVQIQIIDQKLNQLASEMLILHGRNLNLLAKVEEINGMIVDLMAA